MMRQWRAMDCGRLGKCSPIVGGELESHYMGRLAFATRWNFCHLILLSVSSPAFENLMRTTDLFSLVVPGVSSNLLSTVPISKQC